MRKAKLQERNNYLVQEVAALNDSLAKMRDERNDAREEATALRSVVRRFAETIAEVSDLYGDLTEDIEAAVNPGSVDEKPEVDPAWDFMTGDRVRVIGGVFEGHTGMITFSSSRAAVAEVALGTGFPKTIAKKDLSRVDREGDPAWIEATQELTDFIDRNKP